MLGLASLDSSSDSIFQDLVGLLPMTFVVSACLLAVALLDALIFTNRFAGPLLNFRRKFAKLAEGEIPEELLFRGGDKYRDIEKNYNKLRTRMQRLEELQRDTGGVDSSLNEITDRKVVSSS